MRGRQQSYSRLSVLLKTMVVSLVILILRLGGQSQTQTTKTTITSPPASMPILESISQPLSITFRLHGDKSSTVLTSVYQIDTPLKSSRLLTSNSATRQPIKRRSYTKRRAPFAQTKTVPLLYKSLSSNDYLMTVLRRLGSKDRRYHINRYSGMPRRYMKSFTLTIQSSMKLESVYTLVLGSQLGSIQAFDVDIISPLDVV